ncbi:MAG: hypothetical protein E7537_00395 [Ruminococcaceae bacterium]|nr:hypothetical protein [Oscillospiraceae bacterium]
MKKIISLILILVFVLSLCGCKETNNNNNTVSKKPTAEVEKGYKDSITILYSAADTFNPYDAQTETNRQLCRLLYDSLVKTDNEFVPHNNIAQSVEISKNKCTVKLRDVKFSDGSTLTASDVVYSYKLAKKSKTYYGYKLYSVESVSAQDSETVVFKLEKHDPYFQNVLDFPIIKAKSEKRKDSDSVKYPPIGSGRYKVDLKKSCLVLNENYYGEKGSIKKINLINAPDGESIAHFVEIGATDIYFSDISDGTILRMSGTKTNINLNNLVYIGINHKNGKFSQNELRQAISSALDRKRICKDVFYDNALAATGFFNPVWEETKSLQNIEITSNLQITIENLEKIGYNELDKDKCRRNGNKSLRFSLLVNKDNSARVAAAKLIKNQLKECGIIITVVEESYKDYKRRLKKGQFDLYLGEVKITENMDLSELVLSGGSVAYGIKATKAKKDTEDSSKETQTSDSKKPKKVKLSCQKVISGFYEGKNSINDVAVTLQSDMPIVPVCYRQGVLFCNENIENVNNSSLSDIYYSIQSYKIKDN